MTTSFFVDFIDPDALREFCRRELEQGRAIVPSRDAVELLEDVTLVVRFGELTAAIAASVAHPGLPQPDGSFAVGLAVGYDEEARARVSDLLGDPLDRGWSTTLELSPAEIALANSAEAERAPAAPAAPAGAAGADPVLATASSVAAALGVSDFGDTRPDDDAAAMTPTARAVARARAAYSETTAQAAEVDPAERTSPNWRLDAPAGGSFPDTLTISGLDPESPATRRASPSGPHESSAQDTPTAGTPVAQARAGRRDASDPHPSRLPSPGAQPQRPDTPWSADAVRERIAAVDPERASRARTYAEAAWQDLIAGRLELARANINLALAYDPTNRETRDLFERIEAGLAAAG